MFDAEETAKELVLLQRQRRKQKFQASKLDAHTHRLLALHRVGSSLSELQLYLKLENVNAARSTIHNWLKKHGEIRLG